MTNPTPLVNFAGTDDWLDYVADPPPPPKPFMEGWAPRDAGVARFMMSHSSGRVRMGLDNPRHPHGVPCAHCEQRIVGVRYECQFCFDYNICEACDALLDSPGDIAPFHNPFHLWTKWK